MCHLPCRHLNRERISHPARYQLVGYLAWQASVCVSAKTPASCYSAARRGAHPTRPCSVALEPSDAPLPSRQRRCGVCGGGLTVCSLTWWVVRCVCACAQMAEGVAGLHAQGIIHRDLKPSQFLMAYSARRGPCLKASGASGAGQRAERAAAGAGRHAGPMGSRSRTVLNRAAALCAPQLADLGAACRVGEDGTVRGPLVATPGFVCRDVAVEVAGSADGTATFRLDSDLGPLGEGGTPAAVGIHSRGACWRGGGVLLCWWCALCAASAC